MLNDVRRRLQAIVFLRDAQQRACVALGQAAIPNHLDVLLRQPQQPELVRHRTLGFADLARGFFLGQAKGVDELFKAPRFLKKIQVAAL